RPETAPSRGGSPGSSRPTGWTVRKSSGRLLTPSWAWLEYWHGGRDDDQDEVEPRGIPDGDEGLGLGPHEGDAARTAGGGEPGRPPSPEDGPGLGGLPLTGAAPSGACLRTGL